jgi:signal transduction histidine kinase
MAKIIALYIFLLGCLAMHSVAAQTSEVDSLQAMLKKYPADSNRLVTLTFLCRSYLFSDTKKALQTGHEALALAKKLNNEKGQSTPYMYLGIVYETQGNWPLAVEYYLKALRIYEKIKYTTGIASCYNNIGSVYNTQNQYQKALTYFKKAVVLWKQIDEKSDLGTGLFNIGDIYFKQKQYNLALDFFLQSLAIQEEIKSKAGMSYAQNKIGDIYFIQKNYTKALTCQEQALQLAEEADEKILQPTIYASLCEIYIAQNQPQQALKAAEAGLVVAHQMNAKVPIANQYKWIARSHALSKNYQRAYDFQLLHSTLKDSLNNSENRTAIEKLQFDYELEKKEIINQSLRKDKQLQQKALLLQQATIQRQYYGGALIVIVLVSSCILSLVFYRSYQAKKRDNTLLNQQKEEITQQNAAIHQQNIRLEELNTVKNRLFTIITHDFRSPLHSLLSVVNLIKEGGLTNKEIRHMSSLMSDNLGVTIHLLENLLYWAKSQMEGMQLKAEKIDLKPLIDDNIQLLQEQAHRKNICIRNQTTGQVLAYGDEAMIDIVIRNLVSNAFKFSGPRDTVSVSITSSDTLVYIHVADTGQGISIENQSKLFKSTHSFTTVGTFNEKGTGLGLSLCKELVEKNGGTIWFESEVGKGSTFTFTVPKAF